MAHVPDPGVDYKRSSFSGGGNCVEVGTRGGEVYVRCSRNTDPPIAITTESWSVFLDWLKSGGPAAATPATPGSP